MRERVGVRAIERIRIHYVSLTLPSPSRERVLSVL
jgi:hypothetical protein